MLADHGRKGVPTLRCGKNLGPLMSRPMKQHHVRPRPADALWIASALIASATAPAADSPRTAANSDRSGTAAVEPEPPIALPPVIVTGYNLEPGVPVVPLDAIGSREVFGPIQVRETGAREINDLVQYIPAISTRPYNGGEASAPSFSMRGRPDDGLTEYGNVLVDGVPASPMPYGWTAFSFLPVTPDRLFAVDYVRGAHSVRYSPNTVGGWQTEVIFEDTDKGHWLATAELDGRNATREIRTSGYSGRIVLLSRPPGFGRAELTLRPGGGSRATVEPFDAVAAGGPPGGWTSAITGVGVPHWTVERDPAAFSPPQVLRQSGIAPKPSFPLCLVEQSALHDGFVETKFRTVSGEIDQAGGVIWRARDADNYYVCRANALEDNVVLYKVQDGRRQALDIVGRTGGYGVEAKVAPGVWHTLRVEFAGSRFRVLLDGQPLFEVEDATFTEAGRVGLWTKADSVTVFDDFSCGGP